jgi:hypothetical protein
MEGLVMKRVVYEIVRSVMPGLVPGIHVFVSQQRKQDVDGRVKPGHDERTKPDTQVANFHSCQ